MGAGMTFAVSETMAIDAGYRFLRGFSKLKDDVQGFRYDKPMQLHALMLGLRWSY